LILKIASVHTILSASAHDFHGETVTLQVFAGFSF